MPTYNQGPGWRHFWLRRLHSLAGIVFGGYIVVHLTVNFTGWWPKMYQQNVDKIHTMEPMLPLIEILAIFSPLLLHLIYGLYAAKAGTKYNTIKYNYGGNVRYLLQRITAFILVLFVLYHIGTLHKWGLALVTKDQGYPLFNAENMAYQTTAGAIKTPYMNTAANVAVSGFYLLGVWAAVFHFANGLWTAAIAWGLTVTARAQRRWGHACCAFGIVLLLIGTGAWAAFAIAGKPDLPEEATQTMSRSESQEVHGQATPGKSLPDVTPGASQNNK